MAKILIVDADQNTAEAFKQELCAAGHGCFVEPSARRATEIAEKGAPDLVLIDVRLPGTSGFEVCRRFRRHEKLFTIPMILVSSSSDDEEIDYALAQGADDYLTMPFRPGQLAQRVKALLDSNADCHQPDPVTGLPNATMVRRALQRRISEATPFALAYVELLHLPAFAETYGAEARDKAVAWLAQAFQTRIAKLLEPGSWFVGHFRAGHFVCLFSPKDASSFCTYFQQSYYRHREEMYAALGLSNAYKAAQDESRKKDAAPMLDILLCVTTKEGRSAITPHQLFDIVTRLRQKALVESDAGVFEDKRRGRDRRNGIDRRMPDDRRSGDRRTPMPQAKEIAQP